MRSHLKAVALTSLLGVTPLAMGAGFGVKEQSNSALGSAFAGAGALSENASNQWYNPATLSGLKGTRGSVVAHGLLIDTTFDSADPSDTGDFEDVRAAVPAFYLATPVDDRLSFGLAVNAPFGSTTEYDRDWGGEDFALESELRSINVNPSFSYRIAQGLSVGLGLNYQKIEADLRNANTRLEGDDKDIGWNAGVMFEPVPGQKLGLSYRSKMNYDVQGEITFYSEGLPAPAQPFAGTYNADTHVDTPAVVRGSYAGDLTDDTQLLVGVTHTEWSQLDELVVTNDSPFGTVTERLDWEDSLMSSIGVRHTLVGGTVLRAGYAHETGSQDSAKDRSALVPDADRDWLTLGATFKPVERMNIDVGYAHVLVDDADINRSEQRDGFPGEETVRGTYELGANIIGAQLNYRF